MLAADYKVVDVLMMMSLSC